MTHIYKIKVQKSQNIKNHLAWTARVLEYVKEIHPSTVPCNIKIQKIKKTETEVHLYGKSMTYHDLKTQNFYAITKKKKTFIVTSDVQKQMGQVGDEKSIDIHPWLEWLIKPVWVCRGGLIGCEMRGGLKGAGGRGMRGWEKTSGG